MIHTDVIGHVYCFRNRTNGKRYIGQTRKRPIRRWWEHVCEMRAGSTSYFHNAIRKHGLDAFELEFTVAIDVVDVDDSRTFVRTTLDLAEIAVIAEYNTFHGDGYNLTMGGEGGDSPSYHTREHALKSVPKSGPKVRKPVRQLSCDGKLIAEFESASAAARAVGGFHSNISFCASGRRQTTCGFRWEWI